MNISHDARATEAMSRLVELYVEVVPLVEFWQRARKIIGQYHLLRHEEQARTTAGRPGVTCPGCGNLTTGEGAPNMCAGCKEMSNNSNFM